MKPVGSVYRLPSSVRQQERYRFVRGLGVAPAKEAVAISNNITRFREFVASKGIDPDSLGPFGRNMTPARAR